MKNLIKIFSLAAILGFFAASCNTDPCKDVVCGDHGTCTEGVCNCDSGYEKDNAGLCNTELRAKFLNTANSGNFNAVEVCDTNSYNYAIRITASGTSITKFNITDLYLTGTTMVCDVSANGTDFTIPSQTISTGLTGSGNGSINLTTKIITVNYTISDGTNSQICASVLTPL